MVERKRTPNVPSDDGKPNSPESGVSRRRRSQNDDKYWDFLDEIEAPLWVDLTLECQSGYDDKDDEWFRVNHPFHQCSSKLMISKFVYSAEDHMNSELDILEQSSPELLPSVEKSRGKEYSRRGRLQGNQMVTFNNQHAVKNLNKKSSFVSSRSTIMTGSRTSKGKNNKLAGSYLDSRGKNNSTGFAGHDTGTILRLGDQKFASSSTFSRKAERNSSITITSEGGCQQQQNSLEVSSLALGQARGFLSALKISLRRNCVTRQALRVVVTNGRSSEGQKFSSGKSSTGPSSSLGYDMKIMTARNNEGMTSNNGYAQMPVVQHQKALEAKSNAAGVGHAKPKLGNQKSKAPSINQGNAKVKVPDAVNRKHAPAAAVKAKEKVAARSSCRIPVGGKENLVGKVDSSHKSSTRNTMQVQKVSIRVPEKSMRTSSPVLKERIKGRSKVKKTVTVAKKVYFR